MAPGTALPHDKAEVKLRGPARRALAFGALAAGSLLAGLSCVRLPEPGTTEASSIPAIQAQVRDAILPGPAAERVPS